jgi:hypothetical protein
MPRLLRRFSKDTFASVVREFMTTDIWKGYSDSTKRTWGRELTDAIEDPDDGLGDILVHNLTPPDVQEYLDSIAEWPAKQAVTLRALRRLDSWAGLRNKLPRQVTFGCEVIGSQGGHIPWEEHEVKFATDNSPPHIARAVLLGYYTGQRCVDLAKMLHSDIETDGDFTEVHVIQKKTLRELWIPFHDELKAAYATWERRVPENILLKKDGTPYTANTLGKTWGYHRQHNPALAPLKRRGLVMHGLRGGCCLYLSRRGLTDHQIGDMIGMSIAMVSRYTRLSSQRKNARTAMAFLNKNR